MNEKERTTIKLYLEVKEKDQLYHLADTVGYKRHDFLLASLVVGAVIIQALYRGELTNKSIGSLMLKKGRKIAAALMAIGTSAILEDMVKAIGGEIDIAKGLDQWREVEEPTSAGV